MFEMDYDENDIPIVYVDGVCLNRDKPEAKAGVGVYFNAQNHYNKACLIDEETMPSCQEAELQAAAVGLEQAAQIGLHRIVVATDSPFVVDMVTNKLPQYKRNNWRTLNQEVPTHFRTLMRLDKAIEKLMVVKWKLLEHSRSSLKNNVGHHAAYEMAFNAAQGYQNAKPSVP